jgi:hypothetical protein
MMQEVSPSTTLYTAHDRPVAHLGVVHLCGATQAASALEVWQDVAPYVKMTQATGGQARHCRLEQLPPGTGRQAFEI